MDCYGRFKFSKCAKEVDNSNSYFTFNDHKKTETANLNMYL